MWGAELSETDIIGVPNRLEISPCFTVSADRVGSHALTGIAAPTTGIAKLPVGSQRFAPQCSSRGEEQPLARDERIGTTTFNTGTFEQHLGNEAAGGEIVIELRGDPPFRR